MNCRMWSMQSVVSADSLLFAVVGGACCCAIGLLCGCKAPVLARVLSGLQQQPENATGAEIARKIKQRPGEVTAGCS